MRTHSVVTTAVIASLLLCFTCGVPIQEAGVPKVNTTVNSTTITTIAPAVAATTGVKGDGGITTNAGSNGTLTANGTVIPANGTVIPANETAATTKFPSHVPPEPHPITTTPTTTTPKPTSTTVEPITTTKLPPTTEKPTIPTKPTAPSTTTTKPTPTTAKPVPSTEPSKPTEAPTAAPHHDRKFDGPSFIGGIILACGLSAIGFVAFKFYKARTEHNYHTL